MRQMNMFNFCLCLCCVILVACGKDKTDDSGANTSNAKRKMTIEQQQIQASQKALSFIEKKITKDPNNAINYQSKAAILQSLGRDNEAVSALERFVELNPIAEAYVGLGLSLDKIGQTEKATEYYRKGLRDYNQRIKQGSPNSNTKAQRAFVLFLPDKHDEAHAIVEEMLKADPHDHEANNLKVVFETYPNRVAFINEKLQRISTQRPCERKG